MTTRFFRVILIIVLILSFAALACISGGGGGRSSYNATATAWAQQAYDATAAEGAELFHAQLTEMAKP